MSSVNAMDKGRLNIFNIRYSSANSWRGSVENDSGAFVHFINEAYAIRAFLRLFMTYRSQLKSDFSVKSFCSRYAPFGDGNNNPTYYADYIVNKFLDNGYYLRNTQKITVVGPMFLWLFASAVAKMETNYTLHRPSFDDAYLMLFGTHSNYLGYEE